MAAELRISSGLGRGETSVTMRTCVLLFAVVILSVCDRPPSGEADHSKHDHTKINHGVMDDSKMESSPGAAEAPQTLQFIDTMTANHQGAINIALLALSLIHI